MPLPSVTSPRHSCAIPYLLVFVVLLALSLVCYVLTRTSPLHHPSITHHPSQKTPLHSFKMDIEFMRTTLLEMFCPAQLALLMADDTRAVDVLPAGVESLLATLSGRYALSATVAVAH